MNILITTAEWKTASTCMISLAKKGHRITLLSNDPHAPALYSKYCFNSYITPNEKSREEYISFLLRLIKTKEYDLFIPISEYCCDYSYQIKDQIYSDVKILLTDESSYSIARNKIGTYMFALNHGIPIPKTYFPKNFNEVDEIAGEISFPCVIKLNQGIGGSGNSYIDNRVSLICYFENKNDYNCVIQEFIEGDLYGFTAICDRGEIIEHFAFKCLRQLPPSRGVTVYASPVLDAEFYDINKKLIRLLNWTGPIDTDFMNVKRRGNLLIEINPRYSGTTHFAYLCKRDLPLAHLNLAFGEKYLQAENPISEKILYRSVFQQEINSLFDGKRNLLPFFFNFFRPYTKYDFDICDFGRFKQQLRCAKWIIDKKRLARKGGKTYVS